MINSPTSLADAAAKNGARPPGLVDHSGAVEIYVKVAGDEPRYAPQRFGRRASEWQSRKAIAPAQIADAFTPILCGLLHFVPAPVSEN
jgi:hypothetical protein